MDDHTISNNGSSKNYAVSDPVPIPNSNPNNLDKTLNQFSRHLSSILRHNALKKGYYMDPRGFVSVKEILKGYNNKSITLNDVYNIVNTNDKKRFEIEDHLDGVYIRAVQGHTITGINPDLTLIIDASEIPIVVHGTNPTAYTFIKLIGLSRMERNHIHFAQGGPQDQTVISGMRKTARVMIYIDVVKAMNDGIQFYKSSNGVILSNGINGTIDPKYFSKVDIIN